MNKLYQQRQTNSMHKFDVWRPSNKPVTSVWLYLSIIPPPGVWEGGALAHLHTGVTWEPSGHIADGGQPRGTGAGQRRGGVNGRRRHLAQVWRVGLLIGPRRGRLRLPRICQGEDNTVSSQSTSRLTSPGKSIIIARQFLCLSCFVFSAISHQCHHPFSVFLHDLIHPGISPHAFILSSTSSSSLAHWDSQPAGHSNLDYGNRRCSLMSSERVPCIDLLFDFPAEISISLVILGVKPGRKLSFWAITKLSWWSLFP